MSARSVARLRVLVCFVLALDARAHGVTAGAGEELEREHLPSTSRQGTEAVPERYQHLRGLLLHEAILTKDFQGDQQFFASQSPNLSTHQVPHKDVPTSTVTTAATMTAAPLTAADTPKVQKSSGKSKMSETTTTLPPTTSLIHPTTTLEHGQRLKPPVADQESVKTETETSSSVLITSPRNEKMMTEEPVTSQAVDLTGSIATSEMFSGRVNEGVITPSSAPCNKNFTAPEGYIKISPHFQSYDNTTDCSYLVTVYLGYGIEIQVQNSTLSERHRVTLEDLGSMEPSVLANESTLTSGLVVRSASNQIYVQFRTDQHTEAGFLMLHYKAFVLSCAPPHKPANGEVTITSLQPPGEAFFFCLTGYQIQGPSSLTCRNATTPYWSGREPKCLASCGGMIKNATLGRIVSPGFPGNYSNNLTCHWVLEAPEDHWLHVHFEKVALSEDDDRLLIKNGNNIDSPVVYDSYEVEYLPNEGVVSTGRHLFVEFTTDSSGTCTGAAIRYEAFTQGTCYQPFVKYGNYSSSEPSYAVGTVVEFSCNPGYTLEQGSVIIECIEPKSPQWNETEPACRAVCSGEITDSAGVVLSPNWPEAYDKGQDCIWGIHVEEDKRIMLDVQMLHLGQNDMLTFYDGDDLTANILGQYSGSLPRFKLYTSMGDITIQFQSDPATNIYGYNNGFVVHFFEVPRNDTCSELPEITNGWKSTSHPNLIHGTVVTYQCYPGYRLVGSEVLMCQWDLTWSGDVPICEKVMACPDPGTVEHSRRVVSGVRYTVGSKVQYICNKGYALSGSGVLTCYNRDTSDPKWSSRPPKCAPEKYEPCRNPGAPTTGVQSSEKSYYQAGESLSFSCRNGYEVQGEATIRCIPGHPSHWSGAPPACRVSPVGYGNEGQANVAATDFRIETNTAVTVMVPIAVVLMVILAIYLYFIKLQGKSLHLSAFSSPPYDNMTEESAFNNPLYETGKNGEDTRQYEVSI
ncbi:seizure protein 6 isoform X3 [Denticeps clupeoides]|uniref:seizure protein 6 isoform X3 n=1 Tax=Denticeps clupeoides TaxID=299321 RepID=UPI0010A2E914|nr:seizure protein 6-like isoform X3 [Denticeps clupeoides]